MSRTIRRKNQEHGDYHCKQYRLSYQEDSDDPYWGPYYRNHLRTSPDKDLYKVWLKKIYHSDKWQTYNKNPGWYNKMMERSKLRQSDRMKCKKILLIDELDLHPVFIDKVQVPYWW